jgi:hypothetical protein
MANTVIQIKRSSATATPTNGSLAAAEPAYSFNSDKLFLGNTNGTGVVEVGGKYWVDTTQAAFAQANAAYNAANNGSSVTAAFSQANTARDHANSAFAQANAAPGIANSYATAVGIAGNAYAQAVGTAGNNYTITVGAAANGWANTISSERSAASNGWANTISATRTDAANGWANTISAARSTASNSYAQTVGTAGNNYTITVGAAANGWANSISSERSAASNGWANTVGADAKGYANSTFVKLTSPNQTITGNLSVVGALTISGNTTIVNAENLRISDPLIYLAGNNYVSDIVDIGFIGNYVNATGSNVHTGLYREHEDKMYYLFQGYDAEPANNHIGAFSNNMTLAVLNADIRTSNLWLGGANAILTIGAAFDKANAANLLAFNTGIGANAYATSVGTAGNIYAQAVGTAGNAYAQAVGTAGNTYTNTVGTAGNNYTITVGAAANGWANTISSTRSAASNAYAETIGAAANTNAANASYLSTGTVPSARISGAYTGITGVGTLTQGTWNANIITVPYGGTGETTFTQNGILYGNTAGALKVTGAGTEGQVLQASSTGVPQFAMLDGGTF